jgi:hypothetical protein
VVEAMLLLASEAAELWQEAGVLHAHLGNLRAARTALERCLERQPDPALRRNVAALLDQLRTKLN